MTAAQFSIGQFAGPRGRFLGAPVEDGVVDLCALAGLAAPTTLLDLLCDWDRAFDRLGGAWSRGAGTAERLSAASLKVLAPLTPRQVFCTGANYRKHVIDYAVHRGAGPETAALSVADRRALAEARVAAQQSNGAPFVFTKPASAVAGPFDPLPIPATTAELDWELELGVVIGRDAYHVRAGDAPDHIAGYVVTNDITARDLLHREDAKALGVDWLSAKGGPGLLPIGPWFLPKAFAPPVEDMRLLLSLNGEVMQDDTPEDMIFGIPRQIEFISANVRMWPGDLLCTGSPTGNGIFRGRFLQPGDVMEASITGLGSQRTECVGSGS